MYDTSLRNVSFMSSRLQIIMRPLLFPLVASELDEGGSTKLKLHCDDFGI